MARLEIRHRSGRLEKHDLSRGDSLTIGQHTANDICIDDLDVAPFHCRIAWQDGAFRVTAATPAGVQWNGSVVESTALSSGDILRVGDVDIVLLLNEDELLPERSPLPAQIVPQTSPEISLQPLSDEVEFAGDSEPTSEPAMSLSDASSVPPAKTNVLSRLFDDMDELATHEANAPSESDPSRRPTVRRASPRPEQPTLLDRAQRKLGVRPKRPGEQETVRSPLVLFLSGGAAVLILSAATLWFILQRESSQREFDAAIAALNSGQFSQAIVALEKFLQDHPRHKLAERALVQLATARIDQPLAGSVPAWDKGLEALHDFVKQYRDTESFRDQRSEQRQFVLKTAARIALGAADTAKTQRNKQPLTVTVEATQLITLYSPTDKPPKEQLQEIAVAVRQAEAAILQQETFDKALGEIDARLTEKKTLAALETQRLLLVRYAELTSSRPLRDRLQKALDLERQLATREESDIAAQTNERSDNVPPALTLVRRTRTRTDEPSAGVSVVAQTDESCFGLDAVTGEPRWRRVLGVDSRFVPQPVVTTVPALLLFDHRHLDLLLLEQSTGKLIWRMELESSPSGAALVVEGQIFLPLECGHLCQLDAASGRMSVRLKLSQSIGTPVLSHSGERIFAVGRQDVLYVFTRRPLSCERVVSLGHGPGAIEAPPVMLRQFLLLAENDRSVSCRIRLFGTAKEDQSPAEITSRRIDGQVRETPAVRGKQLFIASQPERVVALTVTETNDANALTQDAVFQVEPPQPGPVFLSAGPDEQLWMASSSLRRLQLTKDSLLADKQQLAVGLSSQPLQVLGDDLFLGRRNAYSRGVLFGRADRQRMTAQWQNALGASVIGCTSVTGSNNAATCVTALGDLFTVTGSLLSAGGFQAPAGGQLSIPAGVTSSLRASSLSDGRVVVHCGGEQPFLWIVTPTGAIQDELKLLHPLQANPVTLAAGMLLPLPGRLKLISRSASDRPVEDFLTVLSQNEPPRWNALVALDATQVLALNEHGRLSLIQHRTAPTPHLAEVAHWESDQPIDLPPVVDNGKVFLVDSQFRLRILAANSFEPLADVTLEAPATQGPWVIGNRVLVEVGRAQIVCYDVSRKLERQWSVPLKGNSLVGHPQLWKDDLVFVLRDGQVARVVSDTGEVRKQTSLMQSMDFGPVWLGKSLMVGTVDGSLVSLDRLLE